MKKLHVIKIGGNVIDNPEYIEPFIENFAGINERKVLVHGGGKLASTLAEKLGIKQVLVEGRRITNIKTLKITTMVYGGLINKNIVAKLQKYNCNSIGFCGADGNLIKSKKREFDKVDFGYVGDILDEGINVDLLDTILKMGITPVISPITYDGKGGLLNTNADTIAAAIAIGLSSIYDVELTFCFEKNGILLDTRREDSFIHELHKKQYDDLKERGIVSNGMIPKLDNAFSALDKGVKAINICHSQNITSNMSKIKGTQLINI
jgi:acetylglutamate kinase